MTERVVDRLEPIDIDEQHRHRNAVAAVTLQLATDDFVEEPAIAANRHRIGAHTPSVIPIRRIWLCADSSRRLVRRNSQVMSSNVISCIPSAAIRYRTRLKT